MIEGGCAALQKPIPLGFEKESHVVMCGGGRAYACQLADAGCLGDGRMTSRGCVSYRWEFGDMDAFENWYYCIAEYEWNDVYGFIRRDACENRGPLRVVGYCSQIW